MSKFMRDSVAAWVAFAVAVLGAIASIMLILMFWIELPFNGPYAFGAGYEVFVAIASVLSALLVLHLSRMAGASVAGRVLAPLVAVLLVVEALFALLLVAGVIEFAVSVSITVMALFMQGVWMFWLNQRLYRSGTISTFMGTFGWLIGACLVVGLPISAIGLLLPTLSIGQLLVLGFGIFLAGGAWLIWPIWWLMVGVRMLRGNRGVQSTQGGRANSTSNGAGSARRAEATPAAGATRVPAAMQDPGATRSVGSVQPTGIAAPNVSAGDTGIAARAAAAAAAAGRTPQSGSNASDAAGNVPAADAPNTLGGADAPLRARGRRRAE